MRIQNNIAALNANTILGNNNKDVRKSTERLSTGFRINRAGDDSAGLAISEKMRRQIRGLNMATKNAEDGVSLVKTADGALSEVQDILHRMTELSTQSLNGVYENAPDRENLQKELDQLKDEIDRIANSTDFNGKKLIDGSLSKAEDIYSKNIKFADTPGTPTAFETTEFFRDPVNAAPDGFFQTGDKADIGFEYTDNNGNPQRFSTTITNIGGGVVSTTGGNTYTLSPTDTYLPIDKMLNLVVGDMKGDPTFSSNFNASINGSKIRLEATNNKPAAEGTTGQEIQVVTRFFVSNYTRVIGGVDTSFMHFRVSSGAGSSFTEPISKLDESKINVVGKDTSKKQLFESIFKVNGKKFIAVSNSSPVSAENLKALADEGVEIITLTSPVGMGIPTANRALDGPIISTALKLHADVDAITITDSTGRGNVVIRDKSKLIFGDYEDTSLYLQVGDTSDNFNKVRVNIDEMTAKGLGLAKADITTVDNAKETLERVKNATNLVALVRADLGAMENRLDHTSSILKTSSSNITASESRIRDTDMSKEMVNLTKSNILVNAAQAMLAQANQIPQDVVKLLQT